MVVLDAEVSNSTYTEIFQAKYPDRFFEMYIAEQNMVGTALGLSLRGKDPLSLHLCRLPVARLRSDPDEPVFPGQRQVLRVPCRRLHRRGRLVPDGARGHCPVQDALRQRRPLPFRRGLDGKAGRTDGASTGASPISGRPGWKPRSCTATTKRSGSEAARSCGRTRTIAQRSLRRA